MDLISLAARSINATLGGADAFGSGHTLNLLRRSFAMRAALCVLLPG
jgi:hypothetical protein